MPNPQEPGLRRAENQDVVQDSWPAEADDALPEGEGTGGPVPEENRPGHRPEREQDQPEDLGGAGHGH